MNQAPSELVHGIYQSLVDGGSWPELVLGLADHVDRTATAEQIAAQNKELLDHFDRADVLNTQLVGPEMAGRRVQDTLGQAGPDIQLIDDDGTVVYNTDGASGQQATQNVRTRLARCVAKNTVESWLETTDGHPHIYILVPRTQTQQLDIASPAHHVLLSRAVDLTNVVHRFAAQHDLSGAETQLLIAFLRTTDLRQAAAALNITYETSRKYLKSIFSKSGQSSQAKLIRALLLNPLMLLPTPTQPTEPVRALRRFALLPNGRTYRYFTLGPESGRPIFYIDGIRGGTLDCLGHYNEVSAQLKQMNLRLIANSQAYSTRPKPGAIWTDFAQLAEDVGQLFAELGFSQLPVLTHGYGAHTALGIAHARPDLFPHMMLVSPSNPEFKHNNWREMDFSYHLIHVVARKWPQLLERVLPLLSRSMRKDIDGFNAKTARLAKCAHERAIFTCPLFLERSRRLMDVFDDAEIEHFIEEIKLHARPRLFDLGSIQTPITLFHGEEDQHAPLAGARQLASQLPNATLHELPGMGHHHMLAEWDWMMPLALDPPTQSFNPPPASRRGSLLAAPNPE
ncbi:alpha/beta fold hydrolase [Maritalea myrionectae]|uniref:alpha/beta fold hydrolase n=1 Tax=Maritalea myrionectae TaxID=454601 RepID=UPI00040F712A|nr:alpha/beta hydrolase [Maritalea myrionectae]